jgi:hypothetical protein
MLPLIILFFILTCLIFCIIEIYSLKKQIAKHKHIIKEASVYDASNPLQQSIAKGIKEKGLVEALAIIYSELYILKKQLMSKGVIEPELNYLLGEVYETFAEFDEKVKKNDSDK